MPTSSASRAGASSRALAGAGSRRRADRPARSSALDPACDRAACAPLRWAGIATCVWAATHPACRPRPSRTKMNRLAPLVVRAAAVCGAAVLVSAGTVSAVRAQGLPPVPVPAGNPVTAQKAVLGKLWFWEEQMSANNRVACGTCHRPEAGGGDPRRAPNPGPDGVQPSPDDVFGSPGVVHSDAQNDYAPSPTFDLRAQVTGRASPSFLTGAWFPEVFWDGRAGGSFDDPETGLPSLLAGGALENQSVGPPLSSVEMAHDLRTWGQIEQKLQNARPLALALQLPPDMAAAIAQNPTYPQLFAAVFGDAAITALRIAFAIATYERTLVPDQAPWDQFLRGVQGALTPQQVNGLNIFNGPGRC